MAQFNSEDSRQIRERGSSVREVQAQLERFRKGYPWMKIVSPATPERGIRVLTAAEAEAARAYADQAAYAGTCKFVPASGAASRMFKDIFAGWNTLREGEDVPADAPLAVLARQVEDFAFYDPALFGTPEDSPGYRLRVAANLLDEGGLGYGSKPKGVLLFHRYADGERRTALAEHLVEAQAYLRNPDDTARLVVTVSPEHLSLFKKAFEEVRASYEKRYGIRYRVTWTSQDPATDTIAADDRNRPFRTDDGRLLFRPAGHGALIHNLNAVEEELVVMKNIDNVAHDRLLPQTAAGKRMLMGCCLQLRDRIFDFLRALDGVDADPESDACRRLCDRIESFLDRELCIQLPLVTDAGARVRLLRSKLNRPIRVCGMVRNQGEPGGGPFVVSGRDGSSNLQILEGVQINPADAGARQALSRATHFNPVDLVCCLRDYKGRKFNLPDFVDPEAGFISSKSYHGRTLQALELPGLWNGSMSDWNTLFVEVPLETFNPVKTVLDLLRPAHRSR